MFAQYGNSFLKSGETLITTTYTPGVPSTLLDNLVAYWKLDETTGNALDSVGHIDGSIVEAVEQGAAGKIGTSYGFDYYGDPYTQHVDFTSETGLNFPGEMSISLWAKPYNVTASGYGRALIGDANTAGNLSQYTLRINNSNLGKDGAGIFDFYWDDTIAAMSNTPVTATDWWHIVAIRRGSTGSWYGEIYRNGVIDGSGYITANPDARQGMCLGKGGREAGLYYYGFLDEVGMWSRAITPAEVSTLYNNGTGKTHPFT